jgi:hypothetical protein
MESPGNGKKRAPERSPEVDAFLRWRQEGSRALAAPRRRRWRRAIIAALAVVIAGLLTWVAESARDVRATDEGGQARSEAVAAISPDAAPPLGTEPSAPAPEVVSAPAEEGPRATAPEPAPVERVEAARAIRTPPSPPKSTAARERSRPREVAAALPRPEASPRAVSPAPSSEVIPAPAWIESDLPAAPLPAAPLVEEPAAEPARQVPVANPPPIVAPPPPPPASATTPVAPPPAPDATPRAESREAPSAAPPPPPPLPADPQPKRPLIADKLMGWLEGEMQEVRDTARREIGAFRDGLDKVRSCLSWVGAEDRNCRRPTRP